MIVRRISRTAFTAILAVALLSLPVIAIYATNLANRSGIPTGPTELAPAELAPAELAPAAPLVDSQEQPSTTEHHRDDHSQGAGFSRGRPSWAGGDNKKGEGRRGPKWAAEDDGPPWGLAWGHWLKHGGIDVCDRIAARLENKPDAEIPVDLRSRIEDELGCDLT